MRNRGVPDVDITQLKSRLGPAALMSGGAALLLWVSSLSCFGGAVLSLLAVFVTALVTLEIWVVYRQSFKELQGVCFLALIPAAAVTATFADAGLCSGTFLFLRAPLVLGVSVMALLALLFAAAILRGLSDRAASERCFARIVPALVFVACGGGSFAALATSPQGPGAIAWLIIVTALGDTAAYLAGSLLQGPRMAPELSPAKTWSGSIAGLAVSALSGAMLASLLPCALSFAQALLISVLVAAAGQIGDLMESYLKRAEGTKDFGTLLGSHGGVFDRVDSHFAAAAALFLILSVIC